MIAPMRPALMGAAISTGERWLPLLYLAAGGVPLAFAYKAVNTLDSMIGHREFPHRYFARIAALAGILQEMACLQAHS